MSEQPKIGLSEAREAIQRADFPAAIEILSGLAAEDSATAEVWQQLGVCYLETRQPELALEALMRALQSDAGDAMSHYLLGHAYGSTGQLEPAAACYRRALEVNPGHAKAEEFLIKAESLLESREHYRNGLKLLYLPDPGVEDLNRAIRELVESIAIFDGSPAHDNLRECARKLLALKSEQLVFMPPDMELDPWRRACERGFQCILFKNWVGAREAYDEALAYRASDAFVHHALGFCFVELGEVGDAVRAWLRVLELDAKYDFARFGRPEVDRSLR
ncbi:MAG TPA: tetratricopeptide repeat protein [Terriglobia bacterium]|nr:tetratricopeptide repeat protein [Terriglobia bacterium]